jgi:hypothetical protein
MAVGMAADVAHDLLFADGASWLISVRSSSSTYA